MPIPSSLTNLIPSDDMQGLMRRIEALEQSAAGVPALVQQMVGPQILAIQEQIVLINDLIGMQVSVKSWADASSGMAFTTTPTAYISYVYTVPTGFTRATVFATGSGRCTNTTAGSIYFTAQTRADTAGGHWVAGSGQQIALAAGYQGTIAAPVAGTLTVSPGEAVTLSVSAWTGAATAASGGNFVGFDSVMIFTRQ